jgi:hypothetical protein
VLRANGGRGRIRTSVARKERQIYSLLVLATHPPVRTVERAFLSVKRHPHDCVIHAGNSLFLLPEIRRPKHSLRFQDQLAEGFEPPTL